MAEANKQNDEKIAQVIDLLKELENDSTVPRNVKLQMANAEKALRDESEISLKVHKALNELDEISDDANMQPYTRTQVWNIVSVLESL